MNNTGICAGYFVCDSKDEKDKREQLQKQDAPWHVETPPAALHCLYLVWCCNQIWGTVWGCHSSDRSPRISSQSKAVPQSSEIVDWEQCGHCSYISVRPSGIKNSVVWIPGPWVTRKPSEGQSAEEDTESEGSKVSEISKLTSLFVFNQFWSC